MELQIVSTLSLISPEPSKSLVCRLCASQTLHAIAVYDEKGTNSNLASKILCCLQIKLTPNDVLPKEICENCCSKIDEYFDYFTLCAQAQLKLTEELGTSENCRDGQVEKEQDPQEEVFLENNSNVAERLSVEQSDNLNLESPVKVRKKPVKRKPCTTSSEDVNKNGNSGLYFSGSDDDDIFEDKTTSPRKIFENYTWKCTQCSFETHSIFVHRTHNLEIHRRQPDFKCAKCNKIYTRYRSFARHFKLHSDTRKYSCNICGKRFSQKTVLQSHSTVHSEERPHVCPQCGKAFKQFSSLYLHSRSHLPDQAKPSFACKICNKRLSSKHSMETHYKIHTGERDFVCDICGKRFLAKGSLNYHIMTHDDVKPHSCMVCGKGFKTARLLTKHATLHTGVKPHQCDVCGKQFRVRSALKEHDRIHTGEMPYTCEFCHKSFRFKGILTVHRRQHTGERPYNCRECNRSFTNWANYNKHMKRRHKVDADPPPLVATPSSAPSPEFDDLVDIQSVEDCEDMIVRNTILNPVGSSGAIVGYPTTSDEVVDGAASLFKGLTSNIEHEILRVQQQIPAPNAHHGYQTNGQSNVATNMAYYMHHINFPNSLMHNGNS